MTILNLEIEQGVSTRRRRAPFPPSSGGEGARCGKRSCRIPAQSPLRSIQVAVLTTVLGLLIAFLCGSPAPAVEAPLSSWNPKPAEGDIVIPMPGGLGMVFRRIPVPGLGHWGRTERMFDIGADGQPFETVQKVRIGGSFRDGRRWYNVFAKYEVSVAQYAAVMGQGDLTRGLRFMIEHASKETKDDLERLLRDGADAAAVNRRLSQPVSGLATSDYDAFVEIYNDWCAATPACTGALQRNFQTLAFFRLPAEIEWEYAARGGGEFSAAFDQPGTPAEDRARREFRQALPVGETELPRYAQVNAMGRGSAQPAPIGSLQPLFGLHDIYGNVAELMAGPFALDQFSSRIGGRVARGGSFFSSPGNVRASLREEVGPFVKDEDGNVVRNRPITVGMRLVLGSIVQDRRDRATIEREFTDDYVSTVSTDLAGNTEETARDVGRLDGTQEKVLADFIGGDDLVDYFKFRTTQYGRLRIAVRSIEGAPTMEVRSGSRKQRTDFAPGRDGEVVIDKLVPGLVFVKFEVPRGATVGRYQATATLTVDDPAGATLAEAGSLGQLTDGRTIERRDYVGGDDLADIWKFELTEADAVEVRLDDLTENLDIDLRDSSDRVIESSKQSGTTPERIETRRLEPGTYYIRVVAAAQERGSVYTLRVAKGAIDTAGDTPATARDLGSLGPGEQRILEHVGGTDRGDVFKFTAQEQMRLQLTAGNMTQEIHLDLMNQREQVLKSSHDPGREQRQSIDVIVEARSTYYIAVTPAGDSTAYSLVALLSRVAPFSLPAVAEQTTVSSAPSILAHSLTRENTEYFAKFTLRDASPVFIDLAWGDRQTDLDLYLARDEGGKYTLVAKSVAGDTTAESVSQRLDAGSYIVEVKRETGASVAMPFTLTLRSAAQYSSREQAAPLSANGGAAVYTMPANDNEYWGRFSVPERSQVATVLNWAESSIDLDLEIMDAVGRVIDSSKHGVGTTTERVDRVLDSGFYLVHVYRDTGTGAGAASIYVTVTLTALPQYSWATYDNLDIERGDFSEWPQGIKGITETACFQRCQDRLPGCAGYSYNRWTGACYPKQTLDGAFRRKDPALKSVLRRDLALPAWYPKAEAVTKTSRDLHGSVLRDETRSNRDQCAASCQSDLRCVGYTFFPSSSCRLFDRIDSVSDNRSAQSGLKQQE
jgi:formylglycine-generating enzyme required for sulfatase activity